MRVLVDHLPDLGPLESTLRRVAAGARVFGLSWVVVLGAVVVARSPSAGVGFGVVVAMVWGVASSIMYRTDPSLATSRVAIVVDVAVASLVLYVGYVGDPDDRFAGGFPLVAVAVAAIRGRRMAYMVAATLLLVVVGSVSTGFDRILVEQLSNIIFYVAGAFIFSWVMSVLRRSEQERLRSEAALTAARADAARAEERAGISRHLHDSVLQTLALIQRASGRPEEVVTLARAQERDLRVWMFGAQPESTGGFAEALRKVGAEVEARHRVAIEVVVVGDRDDGAKISALIGAAREAMVNAAVHAGQGIAVYGEAVGDTCRVFVRDRGPGFVLGDIPGDRAGVRESIIARLGGVGGEATVRSEPGNGTEWCLEVTL